MAEVALALVWPAVIGYAEAALAYVGETIRPGRLGRYAIWGVRFGWLAQTALLVAQAVDADGFPWASWAGSLNLFVWMCVGAYLIWGCRASFRLLGLAVMPLAAALLALSAVAGGTRAAGEIGLRSIFVSLHVGLVLAALAGFTIAAGLAGVYLWQDRRLKRHTPSLLRVRAPSLSTLDGLVVRTVVVALALFTAGLGLGFGELRSEGRSPDLLVGLTVLVWLFYVGFLVLRLEAGWRGRRLAYLALVGVLLVLAVRLGSMPLSHA